MGEKKKRSKTLENYAQDRAVSLAKRGTIQNYEKYKDLCLGSGGQLAGVSTTSQMIMSDWGKSLTAYLSNEVILYTGIGVASRNDGAIFFVQFFCNLKEGAVLDLKEPTHRENLRWEILKEINQSRNEKDIEALQISELTTVIAQNWAD